MLGLGSSLQQRLVLNRHLFGLDPLADLIKKAFGAGEQGALYVPQPVALGQQVLYKGYAGVKPTSVGGDPVGFMHDVSRGLRRGRNQAVDGSTMRAYDSNRVTDLGEWFEVERVPGNSNGGAYLRPVTGPSTGEWYHWSWDVEVLNGTGVQSRIYSGGVYSFISDPINPGSGVVRLSVTLEMVQGDVAPLINFIMNDGDIARIRLVALEKVEGIPVIQKVSADRPIYRTDGTHNWLSDKAFTVTSPTNGTAIAANGTTVTETTVTAGQSLTMPIPCYGFAIVEPQIDTAPIVSYFEELQS